MKIPIESGKLKKCKNCSKIIKFENNDYRPIKFEFNYFTCEINCYCKKRMISSYNNGKYPSIKFWYKNKQIHRDDGPAQILYVSSKNKLYEKWYQNGKLIKEKYYENSD